VFRSINDALAAVSAGGTIVVGPGVYHEDVTVTKSVTIKGQGNATIDATNLINGVKITAPHVTVSGLTVHGAVGEGILVQGTSHATVIGNTVHDNDTGVRLENPVPNTYAFCQPIGTQLNDCGEGIHLEGSSHNVVQNNKVLNNAGGILLSDESGPTSDNLVSRNFVADNHTACGIVMAGHNPGAAPGGVPAPKVAGVFSNTVSRNVITSNGLQASGGAGVQMATGLPGGAVYRNTVVGNDINENGHSGVTLHSHVAGQYLNGNVVIANRIGVNNLNGDLDFTAQDTRTTGILIGTVAPLAITVRGNIISHDQFGIFTTGPVTATGEHDNVFVGDAVKTSTN
jgi:parallel beta-helix repeat protein